MTDINTLIAKNRKRTFQVFSESLTPEELDELTLDQRCKFKTDYYQPKKELPNPIKQQALKMQGLLPSAPSSLAAQEPSIIPSLQT